VPPVVDGIGEVSADVEQRIGVARPVEVDPACTDPVVEAEGVEVGLVGEVQG
jgi:hypothetical protein